MTLQFFDANAQRLIETVKLYMVIYNKIKERDFASLVELTEDAGITSQYVILDIIAKIQTLIETTLVLIEAISNGHSSIAKTMTYYDQRLPRQIIGKIRSKKYNFQKILGLPNISNLPLSKEERKVLARLYRETINYFASKITRISGFYDRYRIIYGKWKHGLTIQTGEQFGDLKASNTNILTVLDSKVEGDMPKGYFRASSSDPPIEQWYNAQGILKINQKLQSEVLEIADDLKETISFIVQNHLTYAKNCGEGYLPIIEKDGDTFSFWFPEMRITPYEDHILGMIRDKLSPNIHIIRTNLIVGRIVTDTNIDKSIHEDTVTNVWIKG